MSWKRKAACRGRGDVEWDSFGPVQVLICSGCPVRAECLHAGLLEVESPGTGGMTSEAQRNRIRNGKAAVAEVWQQNETEANEWLEQARRQPTLLGELP